MPAYRTLAEVFAHLDICVHCTSHLCWRSGGSLDGPAFIARYGGDRSLDEIVTRLRCRTCGAPGAVSLINAVGQFGKRLVAPAGPRIQPPARVTQPQAPVNR